MCYYRERINWKKYDSFENTNLRTVRTRQSILNEKVTRTKLRMSIAVFGRIALIRCFTTYGCRRFWLKSDWLIKVFNDDNDDYLARLNVTACSARTLSIHTKLARIPITALIRAHIASTAIAFFARFEYAITAFCTAKYTLLLRCITQTIVDATIQSSLQIFETAVGPKRRCNTTKMIQKKVNWLSIIDNEPRRCSHNACGTWTFAFVIIMFHTQIVTHFMRNCGGNRCGVIAMILNGKMNQYDSWHTTSTPPEKSYEHIVPLNALPTTPLPKRIFLQEKRRYIYKTLLNIRKHMRIVMRMIVQQTFSIVKKCCQRLIGIFRYRNSISILPHFGPYQRNVNVERIVERVDNICNRYHTLMQHFLFLFVFFVLEK